MGVKLALTHEKRAEILKKKKTPIDEDILI